VVIYLERGADCLHIVQLMPLHPKTPSSLASFKSRLVFIFLVPAHAGSPGKMVVKRACVYVCVCVCVCPRTVVAFTVV